MTQWKFNTTLTNVMSYVTRSISQDMADNLTKNFFLNNLMNLQNMSTIIIIITPKACWGFKSSKDNSSKQVISGHSVLYMYIYNKTFLTTAKFGATVALS